MRRFKCKGGGQEHVWDGVGGQRHLSRSRPSSEIHDIHEGGREGKKNICRVEKPKTTGFVLTGKTLTIFLRTRIVCVREEKHEFRILAGNKTETQKLVII